MLPSGESREPERVVHQICVVTELVVQDPGGLPAAQWNDPDAGVSPRGHTHHY